MGTVVPGRYRMRPNAVISHWLHLSVAMPGLASLLSNSIARVPGSRCRRRLVFRLLLARVESPADTREVL